MRKCILCEDSKPMNDRLLVLIFTDLKEELYIPAIKREVQMRNNHLIITSRASL